MDAAWTYFQYHPKNDYPVYVRLQQGQVDQKFHHLLKELGFESMGEKDAKKISLHRSFTKILTVQVAGPKIQMQINGSDILDKFGAETLSIQGGIPVYVFRKVGLLAMPQGKVLCDMALSQEISLTDQLVGIRVMLTRFLAKAFSEQGILCYWGTIKDGSILVMKQNQSFGESVVIDFQNRVAFYPGGELKLGNSVKLIRKDKEVKSSIPMNREEVVSCLSVNSCLLTFTGITPAMKKSVYDLSSIVTGSYGVFEAALSL